MIKKTSFLFLLVLLCAGCSSTNPPKAPIAKGEWAKIEATIKDIRY